MHDAINDSFKYNIKGRPFNGKEQAAILYILRVMLSFISVLLRLRVT